LLPRQTSILSNLFRNSTAWSSCW